MEPFFEPEEFIPGPHRALSAEGDGRQVARMSWGEVRDGRAHVEFHYMVGHPEGIEHFSELHEISLFRRTDYLKAFREAGLEVEHDERGLMGRGLFLGVAAP